MILVLAAGTALAQEDQKQEAPGPSSLPSPQVQVPDIDGFVVMEEEEWTSTMADEPEKKLEDAMDKLGKGDRKSAAHDLDKTAAYTKSAASRSDGHVRELLLQAAGELNAQAEALRKNEDVSSADLTALFACDMQALAQSHAERAGDLWLKNRTTATGQDLRAAALDVGYAQTWAGLEPDPRVNSAVDDARQVASLLVTSQAVDPDRVIAVIEQMQEITAALEAGVWPETSTN